MIAKIRCAREGDDRTESAHFGFSLWITKAAVGWVDMGMWGQIYATGQLAEDLIIDRCKPPARSTGTTHATVPEVPTSPFSHHYTVSCVSVITLTPYRSQSSSTFVRSLFGRT
jgi:hypothetical protein